MRRSLRLGEQKERQQLNKKLDTTSSLKSWRNSNSVIISSSDSENDLSIEQVNNENENVLNQMHRKSVRITEKLETPRSTRKSNKRQSAFNKNNVDEQSKQQATIAISPPKQSRQQQQEQEQLATSSNLVSPSRLLTDLSIKSKTELETASTTTPRSRYQYARRVLNSVETQYLPGREQQLQELRDFLTTHLEAQSAGSLYVSGQPGTGKTACLSLLLREPALAQRLQSVYINCTSIASVGSIYKKICKELQLRSSARTEQDYLQTVQQHIRKSKRMLLLVLDEIDQLCSSRQEVLYTIFEWPALPHARLMLIGIANSLDLTDRALLRLKAHCELQPKLLHFPPYTKQQIVQIFEARLAEANVLNVFPAATLQLLAAKVSAVSGDVRRALDIGRRVIEMTEQQRLAGIKQFDIKCLDNIADTTTSKAEQSREAAAVEELQPVQVSQVAAVLNNVYGASQTLQNDLEEAFPLQQKLLLCSLMLILRYEKHKDISISRLHEVYRRVCNKRNINALDQTEFTGLIDLVETRGIVRVMRKKEKRLSRVLLQWDEEEVNGALCDKQLIAAILADRSCLDRIK